MLALLGRLSHRHRSRPVRPIQRSVLNCLGDVFGLEMRNGIEVGYCARHFQDAVMRTRAEPLLGHRAFQQALTIGREFAEFANQLRRHLGVAVDFFACGRKSFQLDVTGADHAVEDTG